MRVEQHVRTMRLGHLAIGDRVDQRPAVGLTSKVEHPARRRHGGSRGGELTHERVEPFLGRSACDGYAAARRRTSFPCSSRRTRLRSSRFSADSVRD